MSFKAHNYVKWLTETPTGRRLQMSEKLVLGQLADDHNEDRGCCWPSVPDLATRCMMSDRHCRRILKTLEEDKVIESMPYVRQDGSRGNNCYRFPAIDRPFSAARVETVRKLLLFQEQKRAARPVQEKLLAPDTGVRGATDTQDRTPGPGSPDGPDTEVTPPLTSASGQEPLLESILSPVVETTDVTTKEVPPTPLAGGAKRLENAAPNEGPTTSPPDTDVRGVSPEQQKMLDGFGMLKLDLKSDLRTASAFLGRRFTTVKPSAGATPQSDDNDYDVCFRDWWLDSVDVVDGKIIVSTSAEDYRATKEGLLKYEARLQRIARKHLARGLNHPIVFEVKPHRG